MLSLRFRAFRRFREPASESECRPISQSLYRSRVPVSSESSAVDSLSVWGTYTSTRTAVVHPDYYNLTDHEMFDDPSKGVVGQQLLSSIQE
jgi:hypothetical protein